MTLKTLAHSVSCKIHSYSIFSSLYEIVAELLINSVEAGAGSVEIILDLETLSIAVRDTGPGFPYHFLKNAGEPELLSKNHTSKQNEEDHRGLALSAISSLCAYLFIVSINKGKKTTASIGLKGKDTILNLFLSHFGLDMNRNGAIVVVCRLFNELPVRARRTRAIRKRQLMRGIKETVFKTLLLGRLFLQVSVAFVKQKPWLLVPSTNSARELFSKTYSSYTSHSIKMKNTELTVSGFFFDDLRGEILFHWVLFREEMTILNAKEKRTLQQAIRKLYPQTHPAPSEDRISFYIDVKLEILEVSGGFSLGSLLEILGSEKKTAPKTFQMPTSPHHLLDHNKWKPQYLQRSSFLGSDIAVDSHSLEDAQIIAQIENLIIFVTIGDTVLAVDQHACDERVKFEALLRLFIEKAVDSLLDLKMVLDNPLDFCVDADEQAAMAEFQPLFSQLGIEFCFEKHFEKRTCRLTHLPYCMRMSTVEDGDHIGTSLLHYAQQNNNSPKILTLGNENWFLLVKDLPSCIYKTLALAACRLSIMFGQPLTKPEQEYLIKNLAKCQLPFLCAHGRPTIFPISSSEIGSFEADTYI